MQETGRRSSKAPELTIAVGALTLAIPVEGATVLGSVLMALGAAIKMAARKEAVRRVEKNMEEIIPLVMDSNSTAGNIIRSGQRR